MLCPGWNCSTAFRDFFFFWCWWVVKVVLILCLKCFEDKTGPWFQILYCYNSLGRRKFSMRKNDFWNFFPLFLRFISLCVRKHDFVRELGLWPYTIEANHGESPHVTVAQISCTWALCFCWIFHPFWLFILRAWWLYTLRRQATEKILSPPGRPWCLPG